MNMDFRRYFLIEFMARSYQNYEIKTGVTVLVLELQKVRTAAYSDSSPLGVLPCPTALLPIFEGVLG